MSRHLVARLEGGLAEVSTVPARSMPGSWGICAPPGERPRRRGRPCSSRSNARPRRRRRPPSVRRAPICLVPGRWMLALVLGDEDGPKTRFHHSTSRLRLLLLAGTLWPRGNTTHKIRRLSSSLTRLSAISPTRQAGNRLKLLSKPCDKNAEVGMAGRVRWTTGTKGIGSHVQFRFGDAGLSPHHSRNLSITCRTIRASCRPSSGRN